MSDFDGLSGAVLLSNQLAMYRWQDRFERRRFENGIAADNDTLREQVAILVNDYNKLVHTYNQLREQAIRTSDEAQRLASRLDAAECENARLRSENTELHHSNDSKAFSIKMMTDIIQQYDPTYYRLD